MCWDVWSSSSLFSPAADVFNYSDIKEESRFYFQFPRGSETKSSRQKDDFILVFKFLVFWSFHTWKSSNVTRFVCVFFVFLTPFLSHFQANQLLQHINIFIFQKPIYVVVLPFKWTHEQHLKQAEGFLKWPIDGWLISVLLCVLTETTFCQRHEQR